MMSPIAMTTDCRTVVTAIFRLCGASCLFVSATWSHWGGTFPFWGWYWMVQNAKIPCLPTCSGWWFGTFGYFFPYIGNVIIPIDELIFFRGVGIPPTFWVWLASICRLFSKWSTTNFFNESNIKLVFFPARFFNQGLQPWFLCAKHQESSKDHPNGGMSMHFVQPDAQFNIPCWWVIKKRAYTTSFSQSMSDLWLFIMGIPG